jgi:uncharacterized protein (DUF58 family)
MLTQRGWWFFLTTLTVFAASLGAGVPSALLIALALMIWFLFQWLSFEVRWTAVRRRLRVEREVMDQRGPVQNLWVGRTFRVRTALHSISRLALPFIEIGERVPFGLDQAGGNVWTQGTLAADAPLAIEYQVRCAGPGQVRFEGVAVRIADLQGFFYRRTMVEAVRCMRVFPALADARGNYPTPKRHNLLPLTGAHRHRRPGTGSELLDLRDYRPGDPPKMIAWKPSARRGRLMTKEFESEVPIRCTLLVDASSSVRVGLPGRNALAQLVQLVTAVAQANAAARDLTGLCLFDERSAKVVKPARGKRHLIELFGILADAAALPPTTGAVEVTRLLPLAYGVAQEIYPQLLAAEVNRFPWWLPLWAPQAASSLRRKHIPPGTPWRRGKQFLGQAWAIIWQSIFMRLLVHEWKWQRWRKQVAAILAVKKNLGPAAIGELLEDDERFVLAMQEFLIEHQVPLVLPLYGPDERYLFAAPEKIEIAAAALRSAVARGRDNELFVLLIDLLETPDRLEPLLATVRMALARRHHVVLICPWPAGFAAPSRSGREQKKRDAGFLRAVADLKSGRQPALAAEWIIHHSTTLRLHQAYRQIQRAFARLGVQVVCAADDDSPQRILRRIEKLRVLERGVRS